ncbi:MAG: thioredoxin family protein [Candidatus Saliniplasma sp.]
MQKRVLYSTIIVLALLLVFTFSILTVSADEIDWYSYEDGLSESEHLGQPAMIYFYSETCGSCAEMENVVFSDSSVQKKTEDAVFIKVDANEERSLASNYGIRAVPTFLFTDSSGEVFRGEEGYHDVEQFINLIDEAAAEYEGEDSFENGESSGGYDQEETTDSDNFFRNILIITISSLAVASAIIFYMQKIDDKKR